MPPGSLPLIPCCKLQNTVEGGRKREKEEGRDGGGGEEERDGGRKGKKERERESLHFTPQGLEG